MRRIILKEGPLVFLKKVATMEFLAGVFMYVISFLENYEMLYRSFGLSKVFRYDLFLIVIFSLFQLIYIFLLFLEWYFSYFEFTTKEVTHKSGLLFRRRRSVNLSQISSIEIHDSPLQRVMQHSSLILHHQDGKNVTKIKNIANLEESLPLIKQMISEASGIENLFSIKDLIKQNENLHLEFKETLRFDTRKQTINKELERAILKTLVGFLNTEGGNLVIGVSDAGQVLGLKRDFETLTKANRDGFENHLSQLIKTAIGLSFAKYIEIKFEKIEEKEVCLVTVTKSHKPAYLKNGDNQEEFFVRLGNSTQPLKMSDTEEYIKNNWKN
jgi:membrane protein YdbS with pleckstrin-like domain